MRPALILAVLAMSGCVLGPHEHWINRVPARMRSAPNPYTGDSDAAQAGAKLYAEHCAACHGKDAQGIRRAPALQSPAMQNASPGALFWLLTNGAIDKGMPAWAYLPSPQRWQLITWLKR
jgi:mono/diheme cytochrome c family protein